MIQVYKSEGGYTTWSEGRLLDKSEVSRGLDFFGSRRKVCHHLSAGDVSTFSLVD